MTVLGHAPAVLPLASASPGTASAAPAPAGGAAVAEVLAATGVGLLFLAGLAVVVGGHRSGRLSWPGRVADRLGAATGVPGWSALPSVVATLSLLTAVIGMYWDIALHMAKGRDEGPLANPAHYLILFGLMGLFAAGVLACGLPRAGEKPGPAAVTLPSGWQVPSGGVALVLCSGFALLGFPLDDLWHRLFGQDVTLWGPTHLMLIGGAGLSVLGLLLLEREGREAARAAGTARVRESRWVRFRRVQALGGLLIGLSVFQGEFDFGLPQFRLVLHPVLVAAAAATALVAARIVLGRGGALLAVLSYTVIRGIVALLVVAFGEPAPVAPLYLPEALLVEAAALLLARRPLLLGGVAGLLIGTVGLLAEAAWTQAVFPLAWGSDVLPEALLTAAPPAVALGVVGALIGLAVQGSLPRRAVARGWVVGALVLLAGAVGNGLVATVPEGVTATVVLEEVDAERRTAHATVRFSPAGAVDDPSWVSLTAWQGDVLEPGVMREQSDGSWRSVEPVPVDGGTKVLLRVHDGRVLAGVPVRLPADEALDAPELPAEATSTRPLQSELQVMQRERRDDGGPLWVVASLLVLLGGLVLVSALAWSAGRLGRSLAQRDGGAAGERSEQQGDEVGDVVDRPLEGRGADQAQDGVARAR